MVHKLEVKENASIEITREGNLILIGIDNSGDYCALALTKEQLYEVLGVLHHLQKQLK